MHAVEDLHEKGQHDYQGTAEGVKPQIGHPFKIPAKNNDDLGDDRRDENGITAYISEEKCQEEDS